MPRTAGQFAHERYLERLRAYRREWRWRLTVPLLVIAASGASWSFVFGGRLAAFLGGGVVGFALAGVWFVRSLPPREAVYWERGAEGERRTGAVLKTLEGAGWDVRHDEQHPSGFENFDHIAIGPAGAFLLETKNLSGVIEVRGDALVTRLGSRELPQRVGPSMRRRAAELKEWIEEDTGQRLWVQAVVVIWGDFPAGLVEHDRVVYVAGSRLGEWLLTRPARNPSVEFAS